METTTSDVKKAHQAPSKEELEHYTVRRKFGKVELILQFHPVEAGSYEEATRLTELGFVRPEEIYICHHDYWDDDVRLTRTVEPIKGARVSQMILDRRYLQLVEFLQLLIADPQDPRVLGQATSLLAMLQGVAFGQEFKDSTTGRRRE